MLVSTKVASRETGLSEYELRIGFRQGRYPAIEIGRGTRAKRLRWNLDILRAAIRRDMVSTLHVNRGNEED